MAIAYWKPRHPRTSKIKHRAIVFLVDSVLVLSYPSTWERSLQQKKWFSKWHSPKRILLFISLTHSFALKFLSFFFLLWKPLLTERRIFIPSRLGPRPNSKMHSSKTANDFRYLAKIYVSAFLNLPPRRCSVFALHFWDYNNALAFRNPKGSWLVDAVVQFRPPIGLLCVFVSSRHSS